MDHKEFEAEMNEYIHQSYGEFREYQQVVSGILDEFHSLCIRDNIPYYVAYGSLLGLIRDHGSIPWDYDVDVIVPFNKKEELIAALDRDLGPDFYYVYYNNLPHYPVACLRVCRKGYTYMAFHVDIFFLIGCPEDKAEWDKFLGRISWAWYARHAHNVDYHLDQRKVGRLKRVARKAAAWLKYPITESALIRLENRLCSQYPLESSARCMIYDPFPVTHATSTFGSPEIISVNGHEYCVPKDTPQFLEDSYGDYRGYLPIKDRFDEFYNMYRIVKERQVYYNDYLRQNIEKQETDR